MVNGESAWSGKWEVGRGEEWWREKEEERERGKTVIDGTEKWKYVTCCGVAGQWTGQDKVTIRAVHEPDRVELLRIRVDLFTFFYESSLYELESNLKWLSLAWLMTDSQAAREPSWDFSSHEFYEP